MHFEATKDLFKEPSFDRLDTIFQSTNFLYDFLLNLTLISNITLLKTHEFPQFYLNYQEEIEFLLFFLQS